MPKHPPARASARADHQAHRYGGLGAEGLKQLYDRTLRQPLAWASANAANIGITVRMTAARPYGHGWR